MISPVIKWSGSKRSQASEIIRLFPDFRLYYEPFVGGGSILYNIIPNNKAVCGDICKPLIELWQLIQKEPNKLIDSYTLNWKRLQEEGYQVFYELRKQFNTNFKPELLFFLSRTCVNGLIRFNRDGKFNNSLHYTRKGIQPERITSIIGDWSERIQNVTFLHADYKETTKTAKKGDLIYLDPPYFNTKGRYFGKINYEEFISFLEDLNAREIKFILSYDGKRGEHNYLKEIPDKLYKRHLFLDSGNSSFKKVMDKKCENVKESVYLNF